MQLNGIRIRALLHAGATMTGLSLGQGAVASADDWQVSGFLSQAGVYTSDNAFFGDTDDRVSGSYGETGVIINGDIFPTLNFASQVIARRAGDLSNGNPRFDYINLSYRFLESMNSDHGVRAGRLKVPIGFYGETREVPFTRPGIFMPQGIYWDRVRNTRSFFNGAQYYYDYRSDLHVINIRTGGGRIKADQEEADAQVGLPNVLGVKPFTLKQFALGYEYDGGLIRSGLTVAQYKTDFYPVGSGNVFFADTLNIEYDVAVASFEYNLDQWSLTTEYYRGKTTGHHAKGLKPDYAEYPEVSYAQLSYRLDDEWEFFTRYECQLNNIHDPRGHEFIERMFGDLAQSLDQLGIQTSPDHARYAFDKTVGVAWRPNQDLLFRAEWHHVIGTSWVSNYYINTSKLTKEWDLVAIQVSYRFK